MARTGPDGALWVVDMYRYMIEHPDWLPPEGKKELEPFYRAGEDRGRIYRLVRNGTTRAGSPRLLAAAGQADSRTVDNHARELQWLAPG